MKNKIIFILSFIFTCFNSISYSESFILKSKQIEILKEENIAIAYDGDAISKNKDIRIKSKKIIYDMDLDILRSIGSGSLEIKSKKLLIKYNEAIFNQKKSEIEINGDVKIFDNNNDYTIQNEYILYNQKDNVLSSDKLTKIEDGFGNTHYVDNFYFEINKNLIKVNNIISKDSKLNTFKSSIAFINTNSKKVFGKDIEIDLNDNYRLRGNSGKIDANFSEITKGVFTSCKKRNEECPPWQFNANKIVHDKKKREISYDSAFLKIYNMPIAYFPKFFHPDPTVRRKSGFLIPSIKNSTNSDNYLNTPYFFAISENKDATITPRFFVDEKVLLQTEFRHVGPNSNQKVDFSLFAEKNESSKNHFFYKLDKNLIVRYFEEASTNLQMQFTSDDTYLKSNKIKTDISDDYDILTNSLDLDLYSNDLSLKLNSTIYENLDKKDSDRYEYVIPRINLVKNFNNFNNFKGNFTFETDNIIRSYNTNVLEKRNINNFLFYSDYKTNNYGFFNNHEFLIRNTNSENKNTSFKNEKNFFISSIYQFNTSLPLKKENKYYQKIFKPKLSLKVAPNHTKNDNEREQKIDITNIYSLDRITDGTTIEGGLSAAYGFDYSVLDKLKTKEILNLKIANNLRLKKNDDLPNMNQIGEKISNVFTQIIYKPSDFITTEYKSSVKNNLQHINYENIITEFKINNFTTLIDYLNEKNTSDKNSYISNTTNYSIGKFNNFSFSTRKNKTKDLTEYYNLMYQYKNDCLAASIEYNKDFYSDSALKPDESILFKLTIIPFGELSSPNLKQN